MRAPSKVMLLAAAVTATAAAAWNFEYSWYDPAANTATVSTKPGGGGNCGTGSKQDANIRCDSCHNPSPTTNRIDAGVTFAPPLGFDGGLHYAPGTAYTVVVTLGGEHIFNPDGGPSANGFAGRFETAAGAVAGTLDSDTAGLTHNPCPIRSQVTSLGALAGTTVVYDDCKAILHREKLGITQWTFTWNAPQLDAGVVTFFYGLVDGVGNDRSRGTAATTVNDDVRTVRVTLSP